jgi:hypothetical protein
MMGSAKLNSAPSAQSSIGVRVVVVVDIVVVVAESVVVVDVTVIVVVVMLAVVVLAAAVVVGAAVVDMASAQHRMDATSSVVALQVIRSGSINAPRDGTTK